MQTTLTQRGPWTARKLFAVVAAALALTALLVIGGAKPAHAAPPTLTPSENPVTIMLGSNTKGISVSWNLNGLAKANLAIVEAGGPTLVNQQVMTQTGTAPFTVTYGKSYKAGLLDVTSGATLAQVEITTKRPNINVDIDLPPTIDKPGLAQDIANCVLRPCITSVAFQPHGTYAEFTVKTTKAATFQMAICGVPFSASGACSNPVTGMLNFQPVTEWNSHVMGLSPSRTYYYLVTANDNAGNETKKTGQFGTLHRKVQVAFDEITVSNDSDDHSPCDCSFEFEVDGKWAHYPGHVTGVQISTGQSINPGVSITVHPAPESMLIRVFGLDNDKTGSIFQSCAGGVPTLGWGSGSNSCWDWASESATIQVAATGFAEEFTGALYMRADGGPLTFRAHLTYTVTYAPAP